MATAAQIAANRLNAQKSTGPRTAEGKAASAANALKHGMCAERFFLQEEEREVFAALLADYRERLRPAGLAEERLVERIVQLVWRRDRSGPAEAAAWREATRGRVIRDRMGERQFFDDADPLIADMGAAVQNGVLVQLSRLTVYEIRLSRELQRAKAELKEMQEARRAAAAAREVAADHVPVAEQARALAEAKARAAAVGAPPPSTRPGSSRAELDAFIAGEAARLAAFAGPAGPRPVDNPQF